MGLQFSERGVPILTLDRKIEALKACIKDGSREDAVGHLFDLINHVAPGYRLLGYSGIGPLCLKYGSDPTPIAADGD